MATLYEYYNTGDNSDAWMYAARWIAQTFTPSEAHKITSVKLLLFRAGLVGTVTVSIRATDGSGHPTGEDLCSGTTDGDTLPTGSPYEWREITLGDGYDLSADTKYAIVVRISTADSIYLKWRMDNSSPTYEGGNLEYSNYSGESNWTATTTQDLMFEEYEEAAGITVTPPTLALTITLYAPTVTATDNKVVTPSTLALTLTTFEPTVSTPRLVTPSTLALTLTEFAPTVTATQNVLVTPSTLVLTLTKYAPTVTATDNKIVTPPTLSLTLTTYAPSVYITEILRPNAAGDSTEWICVGDDINYQMVDEASQDGDATYVKEWATGEKDLYNIANHSIGSGTIKFVKLYAWIKRYSASQTRMHIGVKSGTTEDWGSEISTTDSWVEHTRQFNTDPNTGTNWTRAAVDALQIGVKTGEGDWLGGACTQIYVGVAYTVGVVVTPPTLALTLTTYAPTVSVSGNIIVTPSTLALTLTSYAPIIGLKVTPSTLALILTTFAPSINISADKIVTPPTLALILTTYAPVVTATGHIIVTPSTLALILTLYAPIITVSGNIIVTPSVLALVLTAYAPTLIIPGLLRVVRVITSQYRDVASITSQKRIAKAITSTKRKVRVITSGG